MVSAAEVSGSFVREVLPLEAILMHFLQHNWHNQSDITDLRQEGYNRLWLPSEPLQACKPLAIASWNRVWNRGGNSRRHRP